MTGPATAVTTLAYMLGSDVLETQAIDPQVTEWTQVFTEMMQDTRDLVIRDSISSGTNVAYAGGATVRSGIASGSAYYLAWADLRNAREILKAANAPTFEAGRYVAIMHPEVAKTLFADTNVINAFQYAGPRTSDNPLFTGALADLQGIRFYETSNSKTFSGLGQSAGSVWVTFFLGRDAYTVTEFSALAAQVVFHAIGTSGINDPLNQVWSLGFKTALVGKIVDDNRILRYESGPNEVGTP